MRKVYLFILLFIVGCVTSPKLTEQEEKIILKRGSYSVEGCVLVAELRELIPVTFDNPPVDYSGNALKRAAAKFNANTVVVLKDGNFNEYAFGTAYKCNPAK